MFKGGDYSLVLTWPGQQVETFDTLVADVLDSTEEVFTDFTALVEGDGTLYLLRRDRHGNPKIKNDPLQKPEIGRCLLTTVSPLPRYD
ncbi:hypothetical protein GCM10023069_71110 [Shinella granuli]